MPLQQPHATCFPLQYSQLVICRLGLDQQQAHTRLVGSSARTTLAMQPCFSGRGSTVTIILKAYQLTVTVLHQYQTPQDTPLAACCSSSSDSGMQSGFRGLGDCRAACGIGPAGGHDAAGSLLQGWS